MSWPKKVVLFGKTGDGKSTVANMLCSEDPGGEFEVGNSLEAVTKGTKALTNSKSQWTIIDTEGMFATDEPEKEEKRARELRNELAKEHPDIDVFCYIKKASRFTRADEHSWKAFNTLLTDICNFHDNVLLVFTSCSEGPEWINKYQEIFDNHMSDPGGVPYEKVAVDFPPRSKNPEKESDLNDIRKASLQRLQTAVAHAIAKGPPIHLPVLQEPSFLRKVKAIVPGLH